MKKKISNIKPAKTLTLEFEDGVIKELKFNAYTMFILDEEFEEGSMNLLVQSIKKPYLHGSKIIYAGLKCCNDDVTYEEAKQITTSMDITTILEIITLASDSVTVEEKGKKKATLTKQELEILSQIFK